MPARNGSELSSVLAIGQDGVAVVRKENATATALLTQSWLVLQDSRNPGDWPEFSAPRGSSPRQAFSAQINDDYVVWMETTSTEANVLSWTMFAYDRSVGSVRELTHSLPMDNGAAPPPPPGNTGVLLQGSHVYWAAVSGSPGQEVIDIMGCAIMECVPAVVMSGTAFPGVGDGKVYGVASSMFRGRPKRDSFALRSADVTSRGPSRKIKELKLKKNEFVSGLAVGGGHVNITVNGPQDRLLVIGGDGSDEATVAAGPGESFGYPVATNDFVAWAEVSGSGPQGVAGFIRRYSDSALFSIGNTAGLYNIVAGGAFIGWQESHTSDDGVRSVLTLISRLGQ